MSGSLFVNIASPETWSFHDRTQISLSNGVNIPQAKISAPGHGDEISFQFSEGLDDSLLVPYALNKPQPGENEHKFGLSVTIPRGSRQEAFCQAVDEAVLAAAQSRSEDWFKKKLSAEEVKARYKPLLQPSTHEAYPDPKLKIKLDDRSTTVHHMAEPPSAALPSGRLEPKTIHDIAARSSVVVKVCVRPVWFMKNLFGVSLAAKEVLLTKTPVTASSSVLEFDFGGAYKLEYVTPEAAAAIEARTTGTATATVHDHEEEEEEPSPKRAKVAVVEAAA